MTDAHKNLADSLVATAPSPAISGTTMSVTAGTGGRYPAVPFDLWLSPPSVRPSVANTEIVRVTAMSGDNITAMIRGSQGTTPQTVAVGWVAHAGPTAKWFTDIEQKFFFDAAADFGFVGDGKVMQEVPGAGVTTTLMTGGSATLTVANPFGGGPGFTPADVGKRITVAGAGSTVNGQVQPLVTTILSYTSATVVTLAANAVVTSQAKNGVGGVSQFPFVQWGTDNTAAMAAMVSRVNSSIYAGARVVFGASITNRYMTTTGAAFTKQMTMEGIGTGYSEDIGNYIFSGGTTLAWWGTTSDGGTAYGAFLDFTPTTGLIAQRVVAPEFSNVTVDCRNGDMNQALIGVRINSAAATKLDGITVLDALAVAYDFGVVAPGVATPAAGSLGEAKDATRGNHVGVRARMLDTIQGPATPNGAALALNGVSLVPTTTTLLTTLTTTGQSVTISVAITNQPTAGYVWVMTVSGYPVLMRYTGGGGTTTLTGCTVSALEAINAPSTISGGNIVAAQPGNGACMRLDGDAGANSCCGTFMQLQFSHGTTWGPAAIEFRNSDSNLFIGCYINGGDRTNLGATNRVQKPGVRFCGSATNQTLAARNNTFFGGSPGGNANLGATIGGGAVHNAVNAAGALLAFPSGPNYWEMQQLGNGEPLPVYESVTATATQGAVSSYQQVESLNGGFKPGIVGRPLVAVQTPAASTSTVLVGSLVPVPPQGFQIGTTLRWTVKLTKTAAGAAAHSMFQLKYGATGSTTDTLVLGTSPSVTPGAAADTMFAQITMVVTALGSGTSALSRVTFNSIKGLTTGGFGVAAAPNSGQVVVQDLGATGFNSTLPASGPAFLHLLIITGLADAYTILESFCECLRP